MTAVRSECANCGVVQGPANTVRLMVCRDDRHSYYSMPCPSCSDDIYQPAPPHVVVLLLEVGVRPHVWDMPDELLEEHTGPKLTWDDLLDLQIALRATDLLAGVS